MKGGGRNVVFPTFLLPPDPRYKGMTSEKIKKRIYDLKRLPNTRRGLASGSCSSGALGAALIAYYSFEALGNGLNIIYLIVFAALAEGVATFVFLTWAKAALKLKEEQK